MLKNTKREHYAKTQRVRDEANAPDHLETAADALIKDLARKQASTVTSLDEQLRVRQNFERGTELRAWSQTGLFSLERFRTSVDPEEAASSTAPPCDYSLESIRDRSGLTRRELELSTAEKPGSQSSKLYKFALGNLKREEVPASKPEGHPLNRLKEIEREAFGETAKTDEEAVPAKRKRRKNKKRSRKRGVGQEMQGGGKTAKAEEAEETEEDLGAGEEEARSYRPSLWDVEDVRKLCRKDNPGCRPPKMYTIKDGKIVEVDSGEG